MVNKTLHDIVLTQTTPDLGFLGYCLAHIFTYCSALWYECNLFAATN